jgi:hypothetical protein
MTRTWVVYKNDMQIWNHLIFSIIFFSSGLSQVDHLFDAQISYMHFVFNFLKPWKYLNSNLLWVDTKVKVNAKLKCMSMAT